MNQQDLVRFNQAFTQAQAGQQDAAYAHFKALFRVTENQRDPNLLLWLAFTSPDIVESRQAIEQVERIDLINPGLAGARKWLMAEEAKRLPLQPPPLPPFGEWAPPPPTAPFYNTGIPVPPQANPAAQQPQQQYYYPSQSPMPPLPGGGMPYGGAYGPTMEQPYGYGYGVPPMSAMPYGVGGQAQMFAAPPRRPAMSGGIVFLIFLGYLIALWIGFTLVIAVGGFIFSYVVAVVAAIVATTEVVQRRSKYGPSAGSHPVVVFVLVALFGAFALALYLADFHRFQSRKEAGWYANYYPQYPGY